MNQQRPIGMRDRPERQNGDRGFRGVNMRLDPSQLEEGWASEAINVRFRNGIAETRLGSMVTPWLNKISGGNVQPWSAVYGAGVFRDPNDAREYVLLAAEGQVYACQPNNPPLLLTLPAGVSITTSCRFQQAFDVVLLLRGFDAAPLVMTGIVTGFTTIEPSPTGTGLETIPNALRSVYAANRVFIADNNDGILASDILDYTHYSLTNNYRINQGSDDRIVNLEMFGSGTIVALKGRSVYRVDNVYGDLSAASLSRVTSRYGCVAAESVVDCGNDILWLSQEGVASLTLTERNEIQAAQGALSGKYRMFSEDIQPLIERVNWRYASAAVGAVWNDRYYLALPVDQAEQVGPNLAPTGWRKPTPGAYPMTQTVVAGATYRYLPGVGESLINGATTYTKPTDFVATGTTVTLDSPSSELFGTLQRVYKGVNNVVAVYDFQNQAWTGYDQSETYSVSRWLKARYNDRERLFAVTAEGYVRLMEEGFADRRSDPYVDVIPNGEAAIETMTMSVNGGTTITGDIGNVPGATTWKTSGLEHFTAGWYLFGDGAYGYWVDNGTAVWTAPNTLATFIDADPESTYGLPGVRFYATNGVPPVVTFSDQTGIDLIDGTEVEIPFTLVTRGYTSGDGALSKFTGVTADVQTWHPSLSIDLLADGVNESEALLEDSTRDRTKYTRGLGREYDATNVNNDFYTAYREDYSIQPTSSTYAFTPGDDVYGHLHQESRENTSANSLGRSARIRITNTQGRVRVMQTSVDMVPQPAPAGSTT